VYSLKNQINDKEKLGGKLSESEKETIEKAVEEKIKWLEANANAEVDDFKEQKKSLEETVNPIMTKFYQQSGGAPPGGESQPPPSGEDANDEL
jgi:heat shock protein 5